ncbi:Sensor protein kinase WalK [compost metagenome]
MDVARHRLWRVFSNLLANAIKFSPENSQIQVKMVKAGNAIRIAISDQGIGIPAEMADKIFDLFTPARRPGTSGEESFGLGLAISRQIIEAHEGKLWFENNVQVGTTFLVELPLTKH